jgi:nucleoporin NUP159
VVIPPTLQDKEAERNRTILESSIQPTLTLPKYISHEDYIGAKGLKSDGKISTQIETLFYDINSMVDSLGLNARALTEFIEGHNSMLPDNGRTKEDLDNEADDESWCLVEVDDLMAIQRDMGEKLDGERIDDKEDKVSELYAMRRDLVRAKNKLKEVKRFLEQAKDEEKKEQRRKAPLDKATEARQREIRHDMARFLKVLVEAEEAVSMLKVKLASTGRQAAGQVPTVEAVEKTVKKMTQWAEEKGADMDVLEAQMQKLGLVVRSTPGHDKRASLNGNSMRRGGIFSTPSPKKGASPKKSSSFAVPEESESEDEVGGTFVEVDPRQEVVREMVEARRRKMAVLGRVRDAMRKKGVRLNVVE